MHSSTYLETSVGVKGFIEARRLPTGSYAVTQSDVQEVRRRAASIHLLIPSDFNWSVTFLEDRRIPSGVYPMANIGVKVVP